MITLKELSEKCGVSIATISNVINGKDNVSEKTKKRVLDAVRETGYQPNFMASSLRSTRTKRIAVITEEISAFSSPTIVEGIMSACEYAGYIPFLQNLRMYARGIFDNGEKFKEVVQDGIRQALAIKVDGIIFVAAHSRTIDVFPENLEVPGVVCYAHSASKTYPSVLFNDEKAASELVRYILSKGYKNIGMIMGERNSVHTERRIAGARAALEETGKKLDDDKILCGLWRRDTGFELAPVMIEKGVDAIFCGNDHIAAGVCDYLRDQGKIPGKDIGVCGFDGQEFASYMYPKLTTTKLPLAQIGVKAGELIIAQIKGESFDKKEYSVDCTFIEGKTI
ncbi:MAG: LacI family transcriptional regulator [Treponema sp.]|nr:LacI family transcriptional regulator [Treponema sp.]